MLRARQVETQFKITRKQLYALEKEGKITPHYTDGGQRRYDPADISKALDPTPVVSPADRFREFGASGSNSAWSAVWEEKQRELQGRRGRLLKREMRLNDPVLAAIFFAISTSLRQAGRDVLPGGKSEADVRAAVFVASCFEDMSWSWADQFTAVIDPLFEQGFSWLEVVYKKRLGDNPPRYTQNPAESRYNDGLVGWRKWSPRPAETLVDGDEWILDDNGGVIGINQEKPGTFELIKIPVGKSLHFRTTIHPANNPEGLALHRAAFRPYYFTQNFEEIEGIGVERGVAGLPVVWLGSDRSMSGPNSDFEMATKLVTNLKWDEQMGVVFPGPKMTNDGRGFGFELMSPQTGSPWDIGAIIERYNKLKALIVLAQFIMLGMSDVGSYALARVGLDLFQVACKSWLDSIADTINRHAIPKLIKYNAGAFSGLTDYPRLQFNTVGLPDLETLGGYVERLVGKNVLTVDDDLEAYLRRVSGLPPMSENSRPAQVNPAEQVAKQVDHVPEDTALICPLCGEIGANVYKDHGGLAVCKSCRRTFDPEYWYGKNG